MQSSGEDTHGGNLQAAITTVHEIVQFLSLLYLAVIQVPS